MLTDPQIERYARHVLLREVGGVGQERLLAARIAVVGLGPVGGWVAAYLALAGVGRLDLCDAAPVGPDDLVPLLDPDALGRPRDEALARALAAYNPDVAARAVTAIEAGCGAVIVAGSAALAWPGASAAALAWPAGPAAAREAVGRSGEGGGGFAPGGPAIVACAAGDRAIAGPVDGAGPCPACAARLVGEGPPAPAAALVAGSLAATAALARIAAGATPPGGLLLAEGGGLRRVAPASIACPHRR